jgi:hypothetical protein
MDFIAYTISGTYDVLEHSRKKFSFSSLVTIGHSGKLVEIEVEKD